MIHGPTPFAFALATAFTAAAFAGFGTAAAFAGFGTAAAFAGFGTAAGSFTWIRNNTIDERS